MLTYRTLARVWRRLLRYLPWYFCSSPMLPCSACILPWVAGAGVSSPAWPEGDALTTPEPRLRALLDFLAAADTHIFTDEGLPKLRFFPELLDDVYAVSVLLLVLLYEGVSVASVASSKGQSESSSSSIPGKGDCWPRGRGELIKGSGATANKQ